MSDTFELKAFSRPHIGTNHSRRLRRIEDKIPAVIYGGQKEPTSVLLNHNEISHALEKEGFYTHILTLDVDGNKEKVVIKDIQRHPWKPKIMHADFLRVSAKTKLTMHIPLHFLGEDQAPGVVDQEGVISHHMNEIEVRCLPADLPEFIEVDVSKLNMDETIHLSEIKVPKNVEVMALLHGTEFDQPVVSIHKPYVAPEPVEEVTPEEAAAPEGEEAPSSDQEKASSPEGETNEES